MSSYYYNLIQMQARQKEAEYRQNQIGTEFLPCPGQDIFRIFITGEILTAEDFNQADIFISYKITLPSGWKQEIPEELQNMNLSPTEIKELNNLESITHTVKPVVKKSLNGDFHSIYYFSFPIDLQFIAHYKAFEQSWPTIHFQVQEKDGWDRIFMQGCGFLQIPRNAGTHYCSIQTWKPDLSYREKVFQFFLGGSVRPKKIENISKSQDLTQLDINGPINRTLFNTTSSGKIKMRLNIATQSLVVKKDERINFKAYKFSEQTEQYKQEMKNAQIPSQVNTGNLLGGRFTTTKLNY